MQNFQILKRKKDNFLYFLILLNKDSNNSKENSKRITRDRKERIPNLSKEKDPKEFQELQSTARPGADPKLLSSNANLQTSAATEMRSGSSRLQYAITRKIQVSTHPWLAKIEKCKVHVQSRANRNHERN